MHSRVLAVMPATLARPLATFVHVLVSISCRTSLRMFTGTSSHLGPVMTLHCNTECFTILDSAASKFQIKIKEALHIKWENPILNQQLRHLDLSLSFYLRCSFCLLFYCYVRYFCFPCISYFIFKLYASFDALFCNVP